MKNKISLCGDAEKLYTNFDQHTKRYAYGKLKLPLTEEKLKNICLKQSNQNTSALTMSMRQKTQSCPN